MSNSEDYIFVTPVNRSAQKIKLYLTDIVSMQPDIHDQLHTIIKCLNGETMITEESIIDIKKIIQSKES